MLDRDALSKSFLSAVCVALDDVTGAGSHGISPAGLHTHNQKEKKCQAKDPNNCRACKTGIYAEGAKKDEKSGEKKAAAAPKPQTGNQPKSDTPEDAGKKYTPEDGAAYIESVIEAEKDPEKKQAMQKYWAAFSAKQTVKNAIEKVKSAQEAAAAKEQEGAAAEETPETAAPAPELKPMPDNLEGRLERVKSIFDSQVAEIDKKFAAGEIDEDKYYDLYEAAEAKYEKRLATINKKFETKPSPETAGKAENAPEAQPAKEETEPKTEAPKEPVYEGISSESQKKESSAFVETLNKAMSDSGMESAVEKVSYNPFGATYFFTHEGSISPKVRADLKVRLGTERLPIRVVEPNKFSITIPNKKIADVGYHDMMSDGEFTEKLSKMSAPAVLGIGKDGSRVAVDLSDMPHLLVGGSTGQGKSSVVNSILVGMMESKSPDDVEMYLIDPKGTEFAAYGDMPHVKELVTGNNAEGVNKALDDCINEMRDRNEFFTQLKNKYGVEIKDVKSYRQFCAAHPEYKNLPNFKTRVIAIDEFANFAKDPEVKKAVTTRLALLNEQARSAGIHIIVSTQDPKIETVGDIKANLPARISVKTADAQRSRNILDQNGAEELSGRGDMLLKTDDGLTRIKGAFLNDKAPVGEKSDLNKRLQAISAKYAKKPAESSSPATASEPSKPEAKKDAPAKAATPGPSGKADAGAGSGAPSGKGGGHSEPAKAPTPDKPESGEHKYPNTQQKVDVSHLGFFKAIAAAVTEGLKGNQITYNPKAFKQMGAEKWNKILEQSKASGKEPDYSKHYLSELHPLPAHADERQKSLFKKWCNKYDTAINGDNPEAEPSVKRRYIQWLKDEGLTEPEEDNTKRVNPYLKTLGDDVEKKS